MRVVVGQGTLNINEAEEVILDIVKLIMHPDWKYGHVSFDSLLTFFMPFLYN